MPLTITGLDAAGVPVNYTKTIRIDNQQPTISLSGPADAPSTAGPQYVSATATAGPSGVAGISCAVEGGNAKWYPELTCGVALARNLRPRRRGLRRLRVTVGWTKEARAAPAQVRRD